MIRFKNTRTGREVAAKDGADLAAMVKIEQDRRSGLEAAQRTPVKTNRTLQQTVAS